MTEMVGKAKVQSIQVVCPHCHYVTSAPIDGPSGKWASSLWSREDFLYFAGKIIECSNGNGTFKVPETLEALS